MFVIGLVFTPVRLGVVWTVTVVESMVLKFRSLPTNWSPSGFLSSPVMNVRHIFLLVMRSSAGRPWLYWG